MQVVSRQDTALHSFCMIHIFPVNAGKIFLCENMFAFSRQPDIIYSNRHSTEAFMEKTDRTYMVIDLKSFYASVECVVRGRDPLTTNLVVADPSRGRGTICLAVSPSMKALGVKNRCRLFEIPDHMDYIIAPPQMQLYIDYSARIYSIYLRWFSSDDIHVYSIDEVFIDATSYLHLYGMNPRTLGHAVMNDILRDTGITATCGIGTNLYLAKVALDIESKHVPDHMGVLDITSYRRKMWGHRPLTDFWMVGSRTALRLGHIGIYTMRQIAEAGSDRMQREFGINGRYLYDHAMGYEPVTIAEIKSYHTRSRSLSSGQVLPRDYNYDECLLIVKEMTSELALDLVKNHMLAGALSLYIGYSRNETGESGTGGHISIDEPTSSSTRLTSYLTGLYQKTVDPSYNIRRVCITFERLRDASCRQMSLFDDGTEDRDMRLQQSINEIRSRYGSNSLIRGMDLMEGAMTQERHNEIGGHKMVNTDRSDVNADHLKNSGWRKDIHSSSDRSGSPACNMDERNIDLIKKRG